MVIKKILLCALQVSDVMSQTIVQKLNGLQHISPQLQSSIPSVRDSVTSLLGNLSRTPRLQSIVGKSTAEATSFIMLTIKDRFLLALFICVVLL